MDKPAVTRGETAPGAAGSTTVSGPGQNASISRRSVSFTRITRPSSWLMEAICTISGLSDGRPFAANTASTASVFLASAPRPYTVSVGNATVPPEASIFPASCKAAASRASPSFQIFPDCDSSKTIAPVTSHIRVSRCSKCAKLSFFPDF
ncbi:hypothetical protein D3C76_1360380 [compost metagenome]